MHPDDGSRNPGTHWRLRIAPVSAEYCNSFAISMMLHEYHLAHPRLDAGPLPWQAPRARAFVRPPGASSFDSKRAQTSA
ncbi:hypothetical protein, partial [Polyangium fumosum]|uniref:hypothetical protein n=1 Tax=Polyangium fumosum TaxID=889272 RepID=UPI001B86D597